MGGLHGLGRSFHAAAGSGRAIPQPPVCYLTRLPHPCLGECMQSWWGGGEVDSHQSGPLKCGHPL